MLRTVWTLFAISLCWLAVVVTAAAENWPQWRGPTRDGMVRDADWPDTLKGDRLKLLWRVQLGPSYSGPIVDADRVYTTETVDKKFEVVQAFDRRTGKPIWQAKWEGAMAVPFFAASNGSWIRSTPALDGESLYVAGMRDVLVCLNSKTGAEKWRIDFVKEFKSPLPAFGFVCSPLIDGEYVFVQAGGGFVKIDKRTGRVVWRVLEDGGGMYGSAFSSPLIASLADRRQVLVQTRENLVGIDPSDGKTLWSEKVPTFRGMNILTPIVHGNVVFTSAYGGKSFGFEVRPAEKGLKPATAWTNKAQAYMSSPIVIDGHAYVHLRNQRLACISLADGKECWTSDQTFGRYWSMVGSKNRVLALDENGTMHYFRASKEKFDLIDSRKISDTETWAHLAVSGPCLYVRELNALSVYEWK